MVVPSRTGYLAQPYDTAELARGIDWILRHPDSSTLRGNSRHKAEAMFDRQDIVRQHMDAYEDAVGGRS